MSLPVEDVLEACSFFSQVDGASRARLATLAVRRSYPKGQVIFREGDPAPGVFIVESGLVRVYKLAPNGKEHVLHLASPGMTFAEVAALGEFPCPAFAEALVPTACVLLPTAPFNRLLHEDHRLCLQILVSMAFWIKHLVGLLEGIVLRDAAGRVAAYLLQANREPDGTVSLPALKKHVASHLNLTSETLSRTLRQFRDDGLIEEYDENRIELRDRERLADVAAGFFPKL